MILSIGFSSPKKCGIGAELIKLWMNKPYSHVYLKLNHTSGRQSVYHAAHGMVHFKAYENFLKDNIVIKEYDIELTNEQRTRLLDHCLDLAGEPYSFISLMQIVAVDICHSLNINVIPQNKPGYICSELVGQFCKEELGINFKKPKYLLRPDDIEEGLETFYGKT